MSVSSVRRRMTHRVLVERNTTTDRDGYGAKATPVWASHIASQPCFFYREGRIDSEESVRARGTILHDMLRLMVPLGTDITEKDRINGVTKRDGTVIETGYMAITSVLHSHTHLELRLEKVA